MKTDGTPEVGVEGDTLNVELFYPGVDENTSKVRLGLMHVRAVDDLLIEFDFDRNGWSIKQEPVVYDGGCMDVVGEPEEVAFVDAWNEKEE